MFRLKTLSRIKTSKSRRRVIIVHLHTAIVRILQKALIAMWQGRCAKIILDKSCFCVPLLWLLWNMTLDMSTSLLINLIFFLHWIGAASLINKITDHESKDIILLLFNGKPLVVGFTGPLWICESVRLVKALQTCKKSSNGFENLLWQGVVSHSENFKGKLCCCCWCYIISLT